MHTPLKTYHSTTLTVADRKGREFALEFADYNGEQVSNIAESNLVPTPWVNRAQTSSNWLFFLRIDQIRNLKSFMTEPVETDTQQQPDGVLETQQSEEFNAIETLQRLLFVRGTSLRHRIDSPRLGILLSCWDELPGPELGQSPETLLEARAPLFSRFISSNWEPAQFKIWGLSSTERKLPETTPDLAFAKKGPEHIGYVVIGKAKTSPDLTIPINWLLETA
jgi:hypothetical protein